MHFPLEVEGRASEVTGSGKAHDVGDPWCGNPVGERVPDCDHVKSIVGIFGSDSQF